MASCGGGKYLAEIFVGFGSQRHTLGLVKCKNCHVMRCKLHLYTIISGRNCMRNGTLCFGCMEQLADEQAAAAAILVAPENVVDSKPIPIAAAFEREDEKKYAVAPNELD